MEELLTEYQSWLSQPMLEHRQTNRIGLEVEYIILHQKLVSTHGYIYFK